MHTFFLLILISLGCAQSPPPSLKLRRAGTHEVTQLPSDQVTKSPGRQVTQSPSYRIISLAPSITEELYLLGVEDKIVGVTIFCIYPGEAKRKEKVGTYLEPNLEKIVTLKPDTVFATESQKKETIKKLKELGIKTHVFREGRSFKEISEQFLQLAKILGKEKKAKEIVKLAEKKIKKIATYDKRHSPVKVFLQLGSEPLITSGQGTFINEIIELAGGINIAATPGRGVNQSGSDQGYFRINREKIIQEDPEVIFIFSMGKICEKELKTWLKFKNLKAVKNKRIYILDADKICRPTVTCYLEGLKTVCRLLR